MTLQDVVDHLVLDHRTVKEITHAPRGFKLKAVNREDLLAPTALPFEMSLTRAGRSLIATTGGEKNTPTHFGIDVKKSSGSLSGEFERLQTMASIDVLEEAEMEHAKEAGWYAHWHPRGVAYRLDLPSLQDIEVATIDRAIHFMIDEYNINIYCGVPEFRAIIGELVEAEPEARKNKKRLKQIVENAMIQHASLKQISWSDRNRISEVCDFMNGKISQEELEKAIA